MVNKSDLKENELYWYVYIPPGGINLQVVKMEMLMVEKLHPVEPVFKVMRGGYEDNFATVGIELEDEDYANLFYLNQKDDAEKLWAKEFFKNFNNIHGMEFSDFVTLYKRIQVEHPEWII